MSVRHAEGSVPRMRYTQLSIRIPTAVFEQIERIALAEDRAVEHYAITGLRGILASRALREWEERRRTASDA